MITTISENLKKVNSFIELLAYNRVKTVPLFNIGMVGTSDRNLNFDIMSITQNMSPYVPKDSLSKYESLQFCVFFNQAWVKLMVKLQLSRNFSFRY